MPGWYSGKARNKEKEGFRKIHAGDIAGRIRMAAMSLTAREHDVRNGRKISNKKSYRKSDIFLWNTMNKEADWKGS